MWRTLKKKAHEGYRIERYYSITGGRSIVSVSMETKDFWEREKKRVGYSSRKHREKCWVNSSVSKFGLRNTISARAISWKGAEAKIMGKKKTVWGEGVEEVTANCRTWSRPRLHCSTLWLRRISLWISVPQSWTTANRTLGNRKPRPKFSAPCLYSSIQ